MLAKDFRARAREMLSGRWGSVIGTTLVATLLGANVLLQGRAYSTKGINPKDPRIDQLIQSVKDAHISPEQFLMLKAILSGILAGAVVASIILFIVGAIFSAGLIRYNLAMANGEDSHFTMLFSNFSYAGKITWLKVRMVIFTLLWSLLFIIPGIMKAYSYSMSGFILVQNPEMSAREAMNESVRIMKGNRWRLFCLQFSFLGWMILCTLTCMLGYILVAPYMNAAYAAFYQEVSGNNSYRPKQTATHQQVDVELPGKNLH